MIFLTLTKQTGGSISINADHVIFILPHTGGAEVILTDEIGCIVTETPGQILACIPAA